MTQPALAEHLRRAGVSQAEFARRYRISQPYLSQIISGARKAGRKTAEHIETLTDGFVKKRDLRPDLWG